MKYFLAALVLVGATACGAGSEPATSDGDTTTTIDSSAGPTTTNSDEPTTSSATGETTTTSDRQKAPDFTLELGTGGTYTLSEGEKPVYLVFWAEW